MKYKIFLIIFYVFLTTCPITVNSQTKYYQGQFKIMETLEKISDNADSLLYVNELRWFNSPLNTRETIIAFNQDTMAIISLDSTGQIKNRKVYDYKNRNIIEFINFQGSVSYETYTLTNNTIYLNPFNKFGFSNQYLKLLPDSLKEDNGFNCKIVTYQDIIRPKYVIYASNELCLPFFKFSKPKAKSILDSTFYPRIDQFFDFDRILYSQKVVSFSPVIINPELMSMSTEGIIRDKDRIYVYKEKPRIPVEKLKNIDNGGFNSDIAIDLMNNGLMSDISYDDYKKGMSIDKYYLLTESFNYCNSEYYSDLFSKWIEHDLIKSESLDIFKKGIELNKIHKLDFKLEELLSIIALNEMFADINNRQFIFNSLKNSIYKKRSDFYVKGKAFINNEIDFSELVLSIGTIKSISLQGIAKNEEDIKTKINDFISIVFDQLNPVRNITIKNIEKERVLLLETSKHTYEIPFQRLVDNYIEDEESDTFKLNEYFYNSLVSTAKQISIDFDFDLYIGLNPLISRINYFPYSVYNDIIKIFPNLKLFKNDYYLTVFNSIENVNFNRAEIEYEIPLSIFEKNKDRFYNQCKLKSLTKGECDLCSLIKTSKKIEFLTFIKKEMKSFNINIKEFSEIYKNILRNQIEDEIQLLNHIPNVSFELSKIFDTFPEIDRSGKPFNEVFPEIYIFLNKSFQSYNLRVNPTSPYILEMDYKNKILKVKKEHQTNYEDLFATINNEKIIPGKSIYNLSRPWEFTTTYFYLLTYSQKKELEKIFQIHFNDIK